MEIIGQFGQSSASKGKRGVSARLIDETSNKAAGNIRTQCARHLLVYSIIQAVAYEMSLLGCGRRDPMKMISRP